MRNSKIIRHLIKCGLLLFIVSKHVPVIAQQNWKARLIHYINTKLAKKDGGYGWEELQKLV